MSNKYNPVTNSVDRIDSELNIYDFFQSKGFFFNNEILARYYLSLKAKPFTILSGISGTGKTKIAQLFAEYICQNDNPAEKSSRIAFIPVRPDWTDNKGLLGFYNILDETYHATKLLELLLDAQKEPEKPFFVILDEMNLAKVEHYFSDFLSILESRTKDKPEGESMSLHLLDEVQTATGRIIPGSIQIPANVFFTGTVNVDESTYMFSPKVLDRANVIEFNEVNLAAYGGDEIERKAHLSLINGEVLDRFFDADAQSGFCSKNDYLELNYQAKNYLEEIHALLQKHNLHFGYRVANEVGRFINLANEEVGKQHLDDIVDIQIIQKILPKLHGTRAKLEGPLQQILTFCHGTDSSFSEDLSSKAISEPDTFRFPRSAGKIARMLTQLTAQGYAGFIE